MSSLPQLGALGKRGPRLREDGEVEQVSRKEVLSLHLRDPWMRGHLVSMGQRAGRGMLPGPLAQSQRHPQMIEVIIPSRTGQELLVPTKFNYLTQQVGFPVQLIFFFKEIASALCSLLVHTYGEQTTMDKEVHLQTVPGWHLTLLQLPSSPGNPRT